LIGCAKASLNLEFNYFF